MGTAGVTGLSQVTQPERSCCSQLTFPECFTRNPRTWARSYEATYTIETGRPLREEYRNRRPETRILLPATFRFLLALQRVELLLDPLPQRRIWQPPLRRANVEAQEIGRAHV